MTTTILILIAIFIIVLLASQLSNIDDLILTTKEDTSSLKEKLVESKNYIFTAIALLVIFLIYGVFQFIQGSPYEGHFFEWLNLIVRWFHITIGIAWIGASFYFVFLENSLNRTKNLRDELAGNLWAVHGGGFYYLEKYKIAPKEIPKELHWFKYEAYFTWISGFCLLWIVYYFNADAMLVDKSVADISTTHAILIGLGSLFVSWLVYDFLCKTPLVNRGILFSLVTFSLATALAWFLSQYFNSRAAYIHIGAMLGTLMAGNVFRIIIPSQKAMVKAAKEGKPLDPQLGKHAGLRSLHNNYMTLPVLFVMISNHFPSTFGHPYNWAVLAGISLASAGIKHYQNLSEQGEKTIWLLPISIAMLFGIVLVTAPKTDFEACESEVPFAQAYNIILDRCISCHSAQPTDSDWTSPPNGVKYDTPEEIVRMKDKIMQRVVITKTMPQNNKTGITPEERNALRCWIEQGARIE